MLSSSVSNFRQFGNVDFQAYPSLPPCATLGGHLDTLKWLVGQNCTLDESLFHNAFQTENTELLDYLSNKCPSDEYTFDTAIIVGTRTTLNWLLDQGFPFSKTSLNRAIEAGNMDSIKFLRENGIMPDSMSYTFAIESGRKNIVKYLLEINAPMSPQAMNSAIFAGDFELVKWLRQLGCPFDASVFNTAAMEGRIDIMQWLKENGCPSNSRLVDHAFKSRDSAVIKFARSINDDGYYSFLLLKSVTFLRL